MTETQIHKLLTFGIATPSYQHALVTLRQGKKELERVQHAIARQISPYSLAYFLSRTRKDWTPLVNLMQEQITIVNDIGLTVDDMADTSAQDILQLGLYAHDLEERITATTRERNAAEQTLQAMAQTTEQPSLAGQLEDKLKKIALSGLYRRCNDRLRTSHMYLQENEHLATIAGEIRESLKTTAVHIIDSGVHLERETPVKQRLIEFGHYSREIRGILSHYQQTNHHVYQEVQRGIHDVQSLFHRVTIRSLHQSTPLSGFSSEPQKAINNGKTSSEGHD